LVVFTATVSGVSRNATLRVRRNRVETIALSHTVVSACRPIDGTIRLRASAPPGGATIELSLDRSDIASVSSATLTFAEGTKEAAFTIDFVGPVTAPETAIISAVIQGQSNPLLKQVALDVVRTSPAGCP
jgi:hypothetical protein